MSQVTASQAEYDKLVQSVRSFLGRIKDVEHPVLESARHQLKNELKKAKVKV